MAQLASQCPAYPNPSYDASGEAPHGYGVQGPNLSQPPPNQYTQGQNQAWSGPVAGQPKSQPYSNQYPQDQSQAWSGPVTAQPGSQPQTVVVVQQPEPMPETTGYTVMACLVTWFCCWCLGIASYCVILSARSARSPAEAASKKKTSLNLSIAGIVIGVGWSITVGVLYVTGDLYYYSSYSYHYG